MNGHAESEHKKLKLEKLHVVVSILITSYTVVSSIE
jgi:hypothetical protein